MFAKDIYSATPYRGSFRSEIPATIMPDVFAAKNMLRVRTQTKDRPCHCEERSDEAISWHCCEPHMGDEIASLRSQ
ncbi:MAG: hypothetical protein WCR74_06890 [Betaproteobacteria bacterium]